MFNLALTAAFQNVGKTDNIVVDVGLRILDRVTNASLRSQVYNSVQIVLLKGLIQTWTILNIQRIV